MIIEVLRRLGRLREPATIESLWLLLPTMLCAIYAWTQMQFAVDLWHHVVTGTEILQTGTIPSTDTASFTIAGQHVVHQNWLAQLTTAWLFHRGGVALVQFAAGSCYAVAIALVTLLTWQRSHSARVTAALVTGGFLLAASNVSIRPQALSAVWFAGILLALWRPRPGIRTCMAVPLIELLWTNTHGAFPLGVALPGIFLVAGVLEKRCQEPLWMRVKPYLFCTMAASLAAFINPHPASTLSYVFGVTSKSAARGLEEWLPPSWQTATGLTFFISLAIASLVLLLSKRRGTWIEWLLGGSLVALSFTAQRMVLWWALAMPALLAPHVLSLFRARTTESATATSRESRSLAVFLMLAACLVLLAISTPWTRAHNPLLPLSKRSANPADEPVGALRALGNAPRFQRVFAPMEWSAYFQANLKGNTKVFVDGRVDFYPDSVWEDYLTIGQGPPEALHLLDRYDIDVVVWNRNWRDDLPDRLAQSPSWTAWFADSLSTVYVRPGRQTGVEVTKSR